MAPGRDRPGVARAPATRTTSSTCSTASSRSLLGDGDVPAPAGTFVLVPPGVEHTFANRTATPVRVLNIHAPAGFDRRLMGD